MSLEQRACLGHVRPFRESFAPPLIILGNRVKLRKVKSDGFDHSRVPFVAPVPASGRQSLTQRSLRPQPEPDVVSKNREVRVVVGAEHQQPLAVFTSDLHKSLT